MTGGSKVTTIEPKETQTAAGRHREPDFHNNYIGNFTKTRSLDRVLETEDGRRLLDRPDTRLSQTIPIKSR